MAIKPVSKTKSPSPPEKPEEPEKPKEKPDFKTLDKNKDNKLDEKEQEGLDVPKTADTDGDGSLSLEEYEAYSKRA